MNRTALRATFLFAISAQTVLVCAGDVPSALTSLKTLKAEVREDIQGWTLVTQPDGSDLKHQDPETHRKMRLAFDGRAWRMETPENSKDGKGHLITGFYRENWDGKRWISYTYRPGLEAKGGTGILFEEPVPRFYPLSFGYQIQGRPIADLIRAGVLGRRANSLNGRIGKRTIRVELDPNKDDFPTTITTETPSDGGRTFETFEPRELHKTNGAWIPGKGHYLYRIVASDGVTIREIRADVTIQNPVVNATVTPIEARLPHGYRFSGKDDELFVADAKGDPAHAGWVPGHISALAWAFTLSASALLWIPAFVWSRGRKVVGETN